ncbi:hypothetical protein [Paenibacillus dakarensis]|uniref:hypothetical protein n=1 Tax=Paenibacillus dakarensis TaxID=1527293 RepID=UPI0006D573A8|nr:hypothetical protein [Paenibacillus dakarensis]
MKKKKLIISTLVLLIIIIASYLYSNRELNSLKSGEILPIQWSNPYKNNEKPIQITDHNQKLSNPNVHITPVYYLPQSKEIHFGLWFNKWSYRSDQIPDRVFQTTIKDENGKQSENELVTRVTSGWFEEFHYRSIPVDLTNQNTVEMTISLIKENGKQVIPKESSTITLSLAGKK